MPDRHRVLAFYIFFVLGFALAYVSNIYIIMILYYYLLPAYFCYTRIIVNVRNCERQF
jgi:hypothetical protein